MSRFNKAGTPTAVNSPLRTVQDGSPVTTHQGGTGVERDAKTNLYLLSVSFMGGDANFYETSDKRYDRLTQLTGAVAISDPAWLLNMIQWVRKTAMMRTVAGVMAVEAVRARLANRGSLTDVQESWNRSFIDTACARADEPGEILAYYLSKYGKPVPQPIKNGVADAAKRLYTQRAFLRYGSEGKRAVTFKDVIRMTHPKPESPEQDDLFFHITNPIDFTVPEAQANPGLTKIHARQMLMAMPQDKRREFLRNGPRDWFRDGEMSWEVISSWLGTMDKEAWEAVIPNMGVMALLRNLRNFDKVEISDEFAATHIFPKLTDDDEIAKSRILPMRVLSAYRNAPSVRWSYPLEQCLNKTLTNIPELPGKTLVMIDMSGSMTWGKLSDRSQLSYADAAKIFGSVLAVRNRGVELYQYGTHANVIDVAPEASVVRVMDRFRDMGGTRTADVLRMLYAGEDRVIIVTDEQSGFGQGSVGSHLPANVPMYTWNLAGYGISHASSGSGNKYIFGGGFSDATFGMIPLLESGKNAKWPWED